jgi:hypothetical protein
MTANNPGWGTAGQYSLSDINGDGRSELVFAANNGTYKAAFFNNVGVIGTTINSILRDGTQTLGQTVSADINGDGILDRIFNQAISGALITGSNTGTRISLGKQDGTFGEALLSTSWYGDSEMFYGDVNGDGRADLQVLAVDRLVHHPEDLQLDVVGEGLLPPLHAGSPRIALFLTSLERHSLPKEPQHARHHRDDREGRDADQDRDDLVLDLVAHCGTPVHTSASVRGLARRTRYNSQNGGASGRPAPAACHCSCSTCHWRSAAPDASPSFSPG